jgi:hypothetical protein
MHVICSVGLHFYRLPHRVCIFILLTLLISSYLIPAKLDFKNLIRACSSPICHFPRFASKQRMAARALYNVICVIKYFVYQNFLIATHKHQIFHARSEE